MLLYFYVINRCVILLSLFLVSVKFATRTAAAPAASPTPIGIARMLCSFYSKLFRHVVSSNIEVFM